MTWPDGIALAVGLTTIALLAPHQHKQRSITQPQHRTEAGHGHQDPQDHGEEDGNHGEEDHAGTEGHR